MHDDHTYNLPDQFYLANNICDLIDDEELNRLGSHIKKLVERDETSRQGWLEQNDKWMELVTQVIEEKTYPWKGASNIKFPLISTAAVQFHARAFPALLGSNRPVKCRVLGRDKNNIKGQRAERVSTYMSYQVTDLMDDWMGDMDRLLFILPIIGSIYKKTYFSEAKNQIVSELIHPRDLIINYDAANVADARKAHRIWKLPNTVKEMQNRGLWREIPNEEKYPAQPPKTNEVSDKIHGKQNPGVADDHTLQEFYEVHTLLDLDDDGYMEPYIVTMRAADGAIYRIVANYQEGGIEYADDGNVVAITPEDYYTHYFFLPDPESKTHGMGFGTMVGPINEAVNTLINILTDSGHMHSLGGGFLARGVRLRGGAVKFRPSEWIPVQTTGDDLRKGILPLPTKEPSAVLFNLLGLLIDSGKDLSSVQDQMVGRSPGQNQPYSTTQAVMEQGMKVFNGIYKRIYRSMTAEFKKMYSLNRQFLDLQRYMIMLDVDGMDVQEAMQQFGVRDVLSFLANDFSEMDLDVVPTAEPDMLAELQKIGRAQSLMQLKGAGIPLNTMEVTRRVLEAEGHENMQALMDPDPPMIPPDVQLERERFEWDKRIDAIRAEQDGLLKKAQASKQQMDALLALAKAQNEDVSGLHDQFVKEQQLILDQFDAVTRRLEAENRAKDRKAAEQNAGNSGNNNSGGS